MALMSIKLGPCRGPGGQNDDQDEDEEGCEGNQAALRPLLFDLAHLSNKLGALFSSFGGFPIGRRTKGNTEDDRSKDPKDREYC